MVLPPTMAAFDACCTDHGGCHVWPSVEESAHTNNSSAGETYFHGFGTHNKKDVYVRSFDLYFRVPYFVFSEQLECCCGSWSYF